MHFVLLFLILFHSFAYNPSLYAPKTDDYIIALETDSFYFLENVPTPPKAKPISEAHFTETVIDEESYAWPGHPRTIDSQIEDEEGLNMFNYYNFKTSLTQEDMYYHPKAPEQTWSTWDVINSLQRTKVKVTLDPYHRGDRITNLYMPPGELITFETLPDASGFVKVKVEPHRQVASINDRLKYLQCETFIGGGKTTWGYPTGGALSFELVETSKNVPIEINVTGCVIAPHFIYGVTDEREWEESIRNLQAPSAMLSNGVINQFLPSFTIRDIDRMDDAQAWWRSASLRSQELAPDPLGINDKYHIRQPLTWRYDNYVYAGIAVAFPGTGMIDFYTDWANSANKILDLKDGNQWGPIHEMNHHHQVGWAYDEGGTLIEVTNNVLNTFTYTYQNSASSIRSVDSNLNPICPNEHLETTHPYCLVDWNQFEAEWDIIFHVLGRDVFKKYMELSINDAPYSTSTYSAYGKHILVLMDATGYDCYEYCKWYCDNTDRKQPEELMGDKFNTFWNAYSNHPAKGKYFHFMGCFYACGFIRNNQRFETVRPYKIYPTVNTTFDFNKALKQRSGDKNLWGDFVFDRIQSNRPEAWTEISKGVYTYKPFDSDLSFIDEALAIYIDRTTGEEYINIVRLEMKPSSRYHTVYYYQSTSDVCNRDMDVKDCYRNIKKHSLYKEESTDYRGIPWIRVLNLTAVTDMTIYPKETGDYYIRATISERGFVYLSENPLSDDYDEIEKYKIITKNWWHGLNDGNVNGGLAGPIHFEKGKKYYFRLVCNNAHTSQACVAGNSLCRAETGETVFIKKASEGSTMGDDNVIPESWFDIQEPLDYRPDLIDFKYNDVYDGEKIYKNPNSKWTINVSMDIVYVMNKVDTNANKYEGRECYGCDISDTLKSWDLSVEVRSGWNPSGTEGQPFPHRWDVNFNGEETFDSIILKGAYKQDYFPMLSNISIYLNSQESSSVDIESDENLIFQGIYDSKVVDPIRFDKEYKGKYLRILVHDNQVSWKYGNPGRSTFSYINVGRYLYISKYKVPKGCNWEVRKDGYYINGRAFVGKAGDTYTYVPDKGINQVAILGDKFVGMGVAKVCMDNVLVKTIDEQDINFDDLSHLKYASRSYRKILFVSPFFNNQPEIRIDVQSGEFRITGFIVGSVNESLIISNGPMPTQTPTAYPPSTSEPTLTPTPEQTLTPTPATPTPATPTPETPTPETPTPETPTPATPTPETPTQEVPTIPVEDIIFDDTNVPEQTRVEKNVSKDDSRNVSVTVKKTNFIGIENTDGGAVHIVNCGLKIDGTVFTECKSKSGGGGAVFVENSRASLNDILFKGLSFIQCSADYGGGAYIYSSSISNKVEIEFCNFTDNEATKDESEGGRFGGSAIYLSAKRSRIKKCKFENNDVKAHLDFEQSSNSKILQHNSASLAFSDCQFKIDEKMKFSFYYYGGKGATPIQLESCTFYGKLQNGAYFIDGKVINKNSPKLTIKSCKYSSKFERALNKNNNFASIDIKDQIFEFDELEEHFAKKKMNAKLISIITVSALAVVIILITTIIIVLKKRINPNKYSSIQDKPEISRDITEKTLITI